MTTIRSAGLLLLAAASLPLHAQSTFAWPEGKRVAVSLSFDDARASQVLTGLDLFQRHHARVTFYVNPRAMEKYADQWKRAVALGHELGSHSDSHPCSGNFPWSRNNALEDYTLARLEQELDSASAPIERIAGVTPVTFAYPCGSKFIGRGAATQSYVPVIAARFRAGRGFRDEAANDPAFCDFAQLLGVDSDGMTLDQMKQAVRQAASQGGWLVFAGHEIGSPAAQTTLAAVLNDFLLFANDPANGIWLDTVNNISSYIRKHRAAP